MDYVKISRYQSFFAAVKEAKRRAQMYSLQMVVVKEPTCYLVQSSLVVKRDANVTAIIGPNCCCW